MDISIAKAERVLSVDYESLSDEVKSYVIRYGLTQILNDAHSTIKSTDEGAAGKAMALAQKKLDAMLAGDIRSHGGRIADPVRRLAMELAMKAVARLPQFKDAKAAKLRAKAEQYVESYMDRAREELALIESMAETMALDMATAPEAAPAE